MLPMPQLVQWAKKTESDIRLRKISYPDKNLSKIDAYLHMIIDRGDIIIKDTAKMNKFMEDINDGLKKLQSYGVSVPETKTNENPLK